MGFVKSAIEPIGYSQAIADKCKLPKGITDEKLLMEARYERNIARLHRFEAWRQVEESVNKYFSLNEQ
jgi:hypothetical protein